jgi:hypothetical protein
VRYESRSIQLLMISLAVLCCGPLLTFGSRVQAQPKVVGVEGVNYNANASMVDNLKSLIGKKVVVTLNSGKAFTGNVKEVGNHLLHLERLEGKEYYDALIVIQDISAIDTRFRADQR